MSIAATPKVYLISLYDEYGSEQVRATLDLSRVRELLDTHPERRKGPLPKEYEKNLTELLGKNEAGGPWNLGHGWGGFQLHIVELE